MPRADPRPMEEAHAFERRMRAAGGEVIDMSEYYAQDAARRAQRRGRRFVCLFVFAHVRRNVCTIKFFVK